MPPLSVCTRNAPPHNILPHALRLTIELWLGHARTQPRWEVCARHDFAHVVVAPLLVTVLHRRVHRLARADLGASRLGLASRFALKLCRKMSCCWCMCRGRTLGVVVDLRKGGRQWNRGDTGAQYSYDTGRPPQAASGTQRMGRACERQTWPGDQHSPCMHLCHAGSGLTQSMHAPVPCWIRVDTVHACTCAMLDQC